MNILIDDLNYPFQAEVNGERYKIRTDFRVSILFELLMQDDTLDDGEKAMRGVELYYPAIPDDMEAAVDAALWFYRCGREETQQQKRMAGRGEHKQLYSFEHDSGLIYAAFLLAYGIDLQDINYMHWWKFRFLFNSLPKHCEFVRAMEYRNIDISDKMPNEQKEFYRKMKRLYALPLPKEEAARQDSLEEALMSGKSLEGLL